MKNGQVLRISQLTHFFIQIQNNGGIPVKGGENRQVKYHLTKCFGDEISFFQ